MCTYFDEAIPDINETVVLKDWFIVLVNADVGPVGLYQMRNRNNLEKVIRTLLLCHSLSTLLLCHSVSTLLLCHSVITLLLCHSVSTLLLCHSVSTLRSR